MLAIGYGVIRRWQRGSAPTFAEELKVISERVALRTKQDGTKIYCLDVKLAT
jgi:hypothetical protein